MKRTARLTIVAVAASLLLGASLPSHAQPAPTPAASPSAEPVQGPTEGNPPAAPAARDASPSGTTNAGEDATEQPFANRLLGDPGGLRTKLAGYGVSLGLTEQSEVLGNPTGGVRRGAVYEGVTSLGLGIDTQKAFGLAGGTFNVTAFQFHGRGLTANNVPTLAALTGVEQTVRASSCSSCGTSRCCWTSGSRSG